LRAKELQIQGQPDLCSENLSQENKKQMKLKNKTKNEFEALFLTFFLWP
jgi:hypothetical protein